MSRASGLGSGSQRPSAALAWQDLPLGGLGLGRAHRTVAGGPEAMVTCRAFRHGGPSGAHGPGAGPHWGRLGGPGSGPRGQLFPQSCDVRSRPALVRGCGSLSHRGRMDVPSPVRSHPCLGRGSPERPPGAGVPCVTAQDRVSVGPGGHRPACPTLCIYSRLPAEVRGPGRGVEGEAGPAGGPALSPGLGVLSCQTLGSPTWFQKGTLTAKKMRSMGGRHEGKEPLSRDGGRGDGNLGLGLRASHEARRQWPRAAEAALRAGAPGPF